MKKMPKTQPKTQPKTEEEWKKVLTPEQYEVLRQKGTERLFPANYSTPTKTGYTDAPRAVTRFSDRKPNLILKRAGRVSTRLCPEALCI